MLRMSFVFVHMLEKPQCLLIMFFLPKSVTAWSYVRKKQKKINVIKMHTQFNKINVTIRCTIAQIFGRGSKNNMFTKK